MEPSWCKDYRYLNKKPNIRERNKWFDERKDRCFLVRWLKLHCFILMFRTLLRPLTIQDFLSISEDLYPEVQYSDIQKLRLRHPGYTFMWLCIRLLWWELFLGAACGMIGAGLNYAGPKFTNHIMDFITNPNPTHGDQRTAYMYCGLWMMCFILRMFFYQHAVWTCFSMAIKANQYVSLLIFQKLMKMSYSYRRYLQQGDFMQYFNTYTGNVISACKNWYILFDAPTTLVVAQIFVYIAAHRYGIALTVIILFVMALQIFIDLKRVKYTIRRSAHYQDRISMHLEFLQNFSSCKGIGFQQLLFAKQTEIRKRENKASRIGFVLQSIYTFFVNFTPEFTIFIIFVSDLAISGTDSSFDTKTVYTLISYISLITGPLKNLPTEIIDCIVAYIYFKRMERLSKIQEVCEIDNGLPSGSFMLKNFVGAWESPRDHPEFGLSRHKTKEQAVKMNLWGLRHRERDEDVQNPLLDTREFGNMDFKLNIPFKVYLRPGERLILLGKNKSGKTSFFKVFLGQMLPRNGMFRYGGTIGYCPQVYFLQKMDAIRDNILFGSDYDVDRLNAAYDFVGLSDHLNKLEFYDEHFLSEVIAALHTSCRQRIPLARAVYYNPDIYLLDDIFTAFDTQSARNILKNFEQRLPDKTLIISTKNTHLIRPQDKVLILDQGVAIQYGSYKQLLLNPTSSVHIFEKHKDMKVDPTFFSENPDHMKLSKQLAQLALDTRDHPLRYEMGKSKQYRKQFFIRLKEKLRRMSPPILTKRLQGVQVKFYKRLIGFAPLWSYTLLVALLIAGQTSNAFGVWWIGHAKKNNWHLSSRAYIGVYTGLVFFYSFCLLAAGLLVAYIGQVSADSLSYQTIQKTIMMDVNFLQTQNKEFITGISSRDNQEFWTMANYVQSIVGNLCYYVATCILSGYTSGYFFILGGSMLVFNYLVVRNYLRAERETWVSRRVLLREYNFRLEDYILGTDSFRAYNKLNRFRDQFLDISYKFNGVYKANLQWIQQARTMYAEMSGIAIVFGCSAFAVGSKFRTPQHIAVIGSSIAFSNRITNTTVSLVNDSTNLQTTLRPSVKLNWMWINAGHEKNYFEPHPPPNWPQDGSIHIENVSLKIGGYIQPVITDLTIDVPSGSKVAVYEKIGFSSVLPFLALINRFRLPTPNLDKTTGSVVVGGRRVDKISARDLRQSIMLIDSFPFVFSGTVRENLDPYHRYTDEEIRTALQKTDLWNEIPVTQSEDDQQEMQKKLNFMIIDGGQHMGQGRKQLINFARILLYKPPVVLCNYAASNLNSRRRFALWSLMLDELPNTTLLVATEQAKIFLKFHTVIYIEDGRVKQVGKPLDLLDDGGKFSESVKMINKSLDERPSRG